MKYLPFLAILALTACTVGQPQTTVAALEVGLTAAETAAYQYATLPACTDTGAGPICAEAKIVRALLSLDQTAYAIIKAAEAQTAKGGNPDLTAAYAALAALQAALPRI